MIIGAVIGAAAGAAIGVVVARQVSSNGDAEYITYVDSDIAQRRIPLGTQIL